MLTLLAAASSLLPLPSSAVEWRLSKGIEASVAVNDNADGVLSGEEKRSETVLGAVPFVRLDGTARRHELSLAGRLELLRFVDAGRSSASPDVSVATRSVLIERVATLSTLGRVSQRIADGNPLTDDEPTRDADTEETWEIGIKPSLEYTIGDRGTVSGDYRFSSIRSSDDARIGSDTHAISTRAAYAIDGQGTLAYIATDSVSVSFEEGSSGRAASVGAGIDRGFGRTLRGIAVIGRDWARPDESVEASDETLWNVALRWEPNRRVRATLGYGERAYGSKPNASLALTGRRSTLELDWSRELSLARDAIRSDALSGLEGGDAAGPLAEQEDAALVDDVPLSPFANEAFTVQERIGLGYSLKGRRSTFGASLAWFENERLGTAPDALGSEFARGRELTLRFGRALSRRVELTSLWASRESRGFGAEERVRENRFQLAVSVRL